MAKKPVEVTESSVLKTQIAALTKELQQAKVKPDAKTQLKLESEIGLLKEEKAAISRQLKLATKKHGIFQALSEEMQYLIQPFDQLPSAIQLNSKADTEEHLVVHLSDEHMDEIVEPHKVGGMEEYNFRIGMRRAEVYVDSIIKWTQQNMAMHKFPVLHILSYGDHSSGEIHGSVQRSEYRNMMRNALAIGQVQALMIRDLAPYFKTIKVYCVPGNHGRRSIKKDFDGAWDNWDYLISETARIYSKEAKNVEFLIPDCFSIRVNINGHGFCIAHGDDIKSWNSIPFYGIERKTRRLVSLYNSAGQDRVDYFVFGHFHACTMSADLKGETIINGAWVATNPYSFESFSGYREPCQLIHGVHAERGITWRLPIKLRTKGEQNGPQRYKVDLADPAPVLSYDAGLSEYTP